eukprot:scaffold4314_cov191-Skeletonema_marinoi.AAC.3
MIWHTVISLFCAAASSSAFVTPIGRVVQSKQPKALSIHYASAATHETVTNTARTLAVAGRIPWGNFILNYKQRIQLVSIVRKETHILDISVMLALALFNVPIGRFLYQKFFYRFREKGVAFEQSITYQVQAILSEAARIGLVAYLFDIIEIWLEVGGFKSVPDISKIVAQLMYSTWIAVRIRRYRIGSRFVDRAIKLKRNKKNMVSIIDKISDFFIFGILAMIWIDILKIKRGAGLSSVFALSGAGTLTLTLATQDLAKKALGGLALASSDKFAIGDNIALGDGTVGVVKNIGWLNTSIKGGDELVTSIPNSQLSNIRVTNRSNQRYSQVKQTLRFDYSDVDRIPALVATIKEEIRSSCPEVVTDGSHPFRVVWSNFEADHLEVSVDCRLRCPPIGDKYAEARQNILIAIARAVKKMRFIFAMPTGTYKNWVDYSSDEEKKPETTMQEEASNTVNEGS